MNNIAKKCHKKNPLQFAFCQRCGVWSCEDCEVFPKPKIKRPETERIRIQRPMSEYRTSKREEKPRLQGHTGAGHRKSKLEENKRPETKRMEMQKSTSENRALTKQEQPKIVGHADSGTRRSKFQEHL
ncbi:uncharacterized protein LY89DRAFT_670063 [Mollisia scopiformis]|uniref:Uncharacterized protein n=1 Tax=Mollisia scopiformis TaxID=149040 RepID=A0A194X8S0_MOLSC|nr:uncharacterized protein LY89DRAFT_670063 [Mollisia scopiformis]KUJ16565.1 hypothetical protein LY89DRAFT_670063 [Mollisia scopiformis]